MKGYNVVPVRAGLIRVNKTQEEEGLMHQLRKVKTMDDQGFVTKGLMYSERKDGVLAEFDIRTDKWDIAQKASDAASKSEIARRGGSGVEDKEKKGGGETGEGAEKSTGAEAGSGVTA